MFQHAFPFDPTYGYSEAELLNVRGPATPAGFADFWRATYDAARAVPPRATVRKVGGGTAETEVLEVEYDGLDGFRVGGWLTRPRQGKATRGVVLGHGYGGRQAPEVRRIDPPTAVLQPCARGFHRSARPDIPNEAKGHVVHGIESRETYLIRACVADVWCAVNALIELEPQTADHVDYMGSSFGGGLGALAIPWEPRFRKGFLGVPTFGNHPLRVRLDCAGSGSWVKQRYERDPSVLDVLAYFDAAVAARHIRIPTAVQATPFDPAVPPPGQFAVYNELAGPRALGITSADHFEYPQRPAEVADLTRRVDDWFAGRRVDVGDVRLPA